MPNSKFIIFFLFSALTYSLWAQPNYEYYHRQVLTAENLIALERYEEALDLYDQLFEAHEFVFLREHKIAAQIAMHLGDKTRAFEYIGAGVSNGWTLKEIKNHPLLKPLKKEREWDDLKFYYDVLREDFTNRINYPLRDQVEQMFRLDQKLALKHYLTPGDAAREKFIAEEAIPHSEAQMGDLLEILDLHGYPGEQLIGNSIWMFTILCHHNSLSPDYQRNDDIYPKLKPILLDAVSQGQMHPYDLAMIDEWYISVKSDNTEKSFGFVHYLDSGNLNRANKLRKQLNIRSVELRNQLVDIQAKTGINLYLAGAPWLEGKIKPI